MRRFDYLTQNLGLKMTALPSAYLTTKDRDFRIEAMNNRNN
jgi:hypothetical protein